MHCFVGDGNQNVKHDLDDFNDLNG